MRSVVDLYYDDLRHLRNPTPRQSLFERVQDLWRRSRSSDAAPVATAAGNDERISLAEFKTISKSLHRAQLLEYWYIAPNDGYFRSGRLAAHENYERFLTHRRVQL